MKNQGIYVHIPFCVKKCNYCDFNSFCASETVQDIYTDALCNEIKSFGKIKKIDADSVFFGGGTPTLLKEENLEKIISAIKESINLMPDTEFTVECNPKTANLKKLKTLFDLGVNRLSLGVQSLDDKILKTLGRAHDLKDFIECFAAARIAGFENISFDLMFALPDQTEKIWQTTLENAIKFEPKHISAYGLQLEEGTLFYENQENYNFPDEDENRKMYEFLVEFLKGKGYNRYEISNFALPGYESRHNLKYWDLTEYVGFGLGSSSFFEGVRYQNPEKMEEYLEFADNFHSLWENSEKETENSLISEYMFLGLRLEKGVNNLDFKEKFNKSFFEIFKREIDENVQKGLLIKENNRIYLSKKGFDLANSVMSDFLLED